MSEDALSFLLEHGMPIADIQKYQEDGLSLEEVAEAAKNLIARGEPIADPEPEPEKGPPMLNVISAPELQRAKLPPLEFLIEGILPSGTSLLTAASKIGKSWMVLDLGLCQASGRPFMGHKTNQCGVLYLALEDSLHRLQNRMDKILEQFSK